MANHRRSPGVRLFCLLCGAGSILLVFFVQSLRTTRDPAKLRLPPYQAADTLLSSDGTKHSTRRPSSDVGMSGISAEIPNPEERTECTSLTDDVFFDTEEDYLLPQLHKLGGFHVRKGLGTRRQRARTEFERCLLGTPPLQDVLLAPDELKSKVVVVSPKPFYHTGDQIQFRADLFDGYGNPRPSGGDDIRMRLVSKSGNTSVAADVADMRNGSYLGTTLLPWNGTAFVEVYVTYSREFLREAVRLRLSLLCLRWTAADYQLGSIRESTGCLPSFPIPGYGSICNLTEFNGGLPYFCGRPTARELTCSHRRRLRQVIPLSSLPLRAPDRQLRDRMNRRSHLRSIPNKISIVILPAPDTARRHHALPPCRKMTPRSTWQTRAPRGWMDEGVWRPFTCSLPDRVRAQHVQQCLRDTSVFLVGDSNLREWWIELRGHLRCSREELKANRPGRALHQHKVCEVESHNTTLRWAFHGRPAFIDNAADEDPLPLVIEKLRHHRRHLRRRVLLVLHYYLHFVYFSLGDFQDRVRAAKQHVQALLREFPDAKVVIRGPHAILDDVGGIRLAGRDLFAQAFLQRWHQEFHDLRDKVWLLDLWDMTVAARNKISHPLPSLRSETVKVLIGFVCDNV